ncbi:hypothetical protein RD792_000332 [Penstemon davidsonii]|uniref:Uncharacterized protein n=1 Tax=Penstemon davidsonii TaxID=160366 RepID=A0ABR0DLN9_9LAMI|nr:hypothetical protein RD792_000332 [Penstemon davidsonii]
MWEYSGANTNGDGVFDNGNAIANMQHGSRLPAANTPYGNTHPGKPTGRWSDGLLDIDYGDRANKLSKALVLFGDVEANDITYSLIQKKSIQKEVIKMGATRVILPRNAPIRCYPFILTELASANPADYDDMGCLKSVNDLIQLKNNDLQQAIGRLQKEFPNTFIMYADFYNLELSLFVRHQFQARTIKRLYNHVVELEENITTTRRGFADPPEYQFAPTQINTSFGMEYTLHKKMETILPDR